MRNNIKYILAFLCMGIAGAAFADSTADSLTKIEEETLLLKARENQLDIKAQIAAKEAEIAARRSEAGVTLPDGEDEPTVQSIEGIGRQLFATLQLHNGRLLDVTSGDVLPNGTEVLSIHTNEVIVRTRRGRHVHLATGAPRTTVYPQGMHQPPASYPPAAALPPSSAFFSKGGAR